MFLLVAPVVDFLGWEMEEQRIQHKVFPECSHVIRAETGDAADMAHEAGVECINLGHGHNLSGGVLSERAEDANDACGGEDVEVVGKALAADLAGGGKFAEFAENATLQPQKFEEFQKGMAFANGEKFQDVACPVGFDPFAEILLDRRGGERIAQVARICGGSKKKPQEPESAGKKTLRTLGAFWGPSEEIITALDPIGKILELHGPKNSEEEPGFF